MLASHPNAVLGGVAAIVLSLGMMVAQTTLSERTRTGVADAPTVRAVAQASRLDVTYPADGSFVTTSPVGVYGAAEPGARVWIGKARTTAAEDGKWLLSVPVKRGENRIVVRVRDSRGETVRVLSVRR